MSQTRKRLFPYHEETLSLSNDGQFGQKFVPGASQPRLCARKGHPAHVRASTLALANVSPPSFSPFVAHQGVLSVSSPPHSHSLSPFLQQNSSSGQSFQHSSARLSAESSPQTLSPALTQSPDSQDSVVLPSQQQKRDLEPLLVSTRSHCAKLKKNKRACGMNFNRDLSLRGFLA